MLPWPLRLDEEPRRGTEHVGWGIRGKAGVSLGGSRQRKMLLKHQHTLAKAAMRTGRVCHPLHLLCSMQCSGDPHLLRFAQT